MPLLLLVLLVLFIALLLVSLLLKYVFLLDQALIPFGVDMLGDCAIEHLLLERLDHLVELLDALLNIAGRKADFPRTFLKVEVLMRWIGLADYL